MARNDLTMGELSLRDHAFYGLVWAGATFTTLVDKALIKAHDLPMSWFEVMLWLNAQAEPVAASDLGAMTLLSRSQVSRVLDSLSARGIVVKEPDPNDARSVRIALTDAVRELFAQANATRRAALGEVFNGRLDEDDIQALEIIWAKLKKKP